MASAPKLVEIARRARVSISTASRTIEHFGKLSEETQEHISVFGAVTPLVAGGLRRIGIITDSPDSSTGRERPAGGPARDGTHDTPWRFQDSALARRHCSWATT